MPDTWDDWGKGGDPFNPSHAIPAQARYMEWLKDYMVAAGKGVTAQDWAIMGYFHGAVGALRYQSLAHFPEDSRGYLADIKSLAKGWGW